MDKKESPVMTPKEVADLFKGRLGRNAIYEAIKRGDIPSTRHRGQNFGTVPQAARNAREWQGADVCRLEACPSNRFVEREKDQNNYQPRSAQVSQTQKQRGRWARAAKDANGRCQQRPS